MVRRLPFKRGFTNIFRIEHQEVNLDRIEERFDAGTEVTPESLAEKRLIRDADKPVVILGRGELSKKLTLRAHRFTKSASEKVLAAGGTAEVLPLRLKGARATVKKLRKEDLAKLRSEE